MTREQGLLGVYYDFTRRWAMLYMKPDAPYCDMQTCVEFCKRLDPSVVFIQVMNGQSFGTSYELIENHWVPKLGEIIFMPGKGRR
jgi:hypothetical protein